MARDERDPGREAPPTSKIAREALLRTLRFVAGHVRGFWGAIAAFVSLGFVAGFIAAWLFGLLGRVVLGGATQAMDVAVLRAVAAVRTPLLDQVALDVTSLGNVAVLVMIVLVASAFLFLSRHRHSAYLLWIAVVGEEIINWTLKSAYDRPRPTAVIAETKVLSTSFPSGHAMASFVAYGAIALLVGRLTENRRMQHATWLVAGLVILVVGSSRVYLGVHYPSDIIGGYLAGFAWLAILASTLTALRFFAPRRPELEQEEEDLPESP